MKTSIIGENIKGAILFFLGVVLGLWIFYILIPLTNYVVDRDRWECVVVKLGGLDKPNECVMYKRKDFKLYGIPSDRHGDNNQQQG